MSRFNYVKYDERAAAEQKVLKDSFEQLEGQVNQLEDGRAKALVLTKLEEAYMWVGKSIRDSQLKRNPSTEQQPERANS